MLDVEGGVNKSHGGRMLVQLSGVVQGQLKERIGAVSEEKET